VSQQPAARGEDWIISTQSARHRVDHGTICGRSALIRDTIDPSSFAVLRQGALRRGNSCLDVGTARCDGAVRAQKEGDTLQREGSLLSRQQGITPRHLQALRRCQKAERAACHLTIDPPGCQPAPQSEPSRTGT
jgi:hypothetical protein